MVLDVLSRRFLLPRGVDRPLGDYCCDCVRSMHYLIVALDLRDLSSIGLFPLFVRLVQLIVNETDRSKGDLSRANTCLMCFSFVQSMT